MNPDSQPWLHVTTYTYDPADRPGPLVTTYTYCSGHADRKAGGDDQAGQDPQPSTQPKEAPTMSSTARFDFQHDRDKGIFRITWPDGEVEVFRDKPVRHLVVEPDFETGAMKPVVKGGVLTYLFLAREEPEVR